MSTGTTESFDVFLSHSHVDGEIVELLGARLEDKAKVRVWLDRWILVPGEHWQQELAKGLDQAKSCAVCIGRHTPTGWFREEIERALNRQSKDPSFRVIPVILSHGDRSLVDNFLELRTWVDFSKSLEDEYGFHILTCGIKGIKPGRNPVQPSKPSTALRDKLERIRELHREQLIDDAVALEYQRRLLDEILEL
jgi:hypothetical protein